MASIIFKGISAAQMGVYIMQMPDVPRPERVVTSEEIPGRSGPLDIDEGYYKPIKLKATINQNNQPLSRLYDWLSGAGDLILTDEPSMCYRATVFTEVKDKRKIIPSGRRYDTLTATFVCEAYKYQAYPDTIPALLAATTLSNPGTAEAAPVITVYGTGRVTLTVGDVSVTLNGLAGAVTIDCDAKDAFLGTTIEGARTSITLDDHVWPTLPTGDTRIKWTGDVRKVTITPNWRWLV